MPFAFALATGLLLYIAELACYSEMEVGSYEGVVVASAPPAAAVLDVRQNEWYRPIHYPQCEAIYKAVCATGNATMGGQSISRWKFMFGHSLSEDLECVESFLEVMTFCCDFPHEPGVIDALAGLNRLVNNPARVDQLEELLLGRVNGFGFELEESPALVDRVKLLGRMPWLIRVSIRMRDFDHPSEELLAAVRSLRLVEPVHFCDLRGNDWERERFQKDWAAYRASRDAD